MTLRLRLWAAAKIALLHFLLSVLLAGLTAALVFGLWYPYPYRELSGGRELFWLVVGVDVVCGPLLTLVLYSPSKPRAELLRDLASVALLQLAALGYGLYTVAQARPVYLVFEVDRFHAVSVADIEPNALKPELGGLHVLPWTGPKVIGVRAARDSQEKLHSLEQSLSGLEPSVRPDWWQPYDLSRSQALAHSKPLAALRQKHPSDAAAIDRAVADAKRPEAALGWLPVTSFRSTQWVALVDMQTADVLAFAPVDGF